tara:strand:+ start:16119 stop:16286 length:168 start_codon:yes stop_codon:yes gene_type:complete
MLPILGVYAGDIWDWNMNLNILANSLLYIGLFLLFLSVFMVISVQTIKWIIGGKK